MACGSVNSPGSITRIRPSSSRRTQAWVYLTSLTAPTLARRPGLGWPLMGKLAVVSGCGTAIGDAVRPFPADLTEVSDVERLMSTVDGSRRSGAAFPPGRTGDPDELGGRPAGQRRPVPGGGALPGRPGFRVRHRADPRDQRRSRLRPLRREARTVGRNGSRGHPRDDPRADPTVVGRAGLRPALPWFRALGHLPGHH